MSFTPRQPNIQSFDQLNEYLYDLELRISEAFKTGEFDSINLKPINLEPDKPRDGDVIYADQYDPGSGSGFYGYDNGYIKL